MCNTDSGDRRWAPFSWLLTIFCLLLLLLLVLLLVVLKHNVIQLYGLWLCDELLLFKCETIEIFSKWFIWLCGDSGRFIHIFHCVFTYWRCRCRRFLCRVQLHMHRRRPLNVVWVTNLNYLWMPYIRQCFSLKLHVPVEAKCRNKYSAIWYFTLPIEVPFMLGAFGDRDGHISFFYRIFIDF